MPYGITQCYLPPGRGDIPAFTPAEAGTRFSDPKGMQGWVDMSGYNESDNKWPVTQQCAEQYCYKRTKSIKSSKNTHALSTQALSHGHPQSTSLRHMQNKSLLTLSDYLWAGNGKMWSFYSLPFSSSHSHSHSNSHSNSHETNLAIPILMGIP